MAVAAGRKGSITIVSSSQNNLVVAEMGNWTISGPGLNMIDYSAFGDERGRQKPGMPTAQTITFDGYHDQSISTGSSNIQAKMLTWLSSGTPILNSTKIGPKGPRFLRLWANDDTTLEGYGFWAQTSSTSLSVKSYVTSVETAQNMDGVATVSYTMAVTGGNLQWTTST